MLFMVHVQQSVGCVFVCLPGRQISNALTSDLHVGMHVRYINRVRWSRLKVKVRGHSGGNPQQENVTSPEKKQVG